MIALSVQKDLSFYLQRLMPILAAVTSLLILLGFVHNNVTPWDSATRIGWELSAHYAQEP